MENAKQNIEQLINPALVTAIFDEVYWNCTMSFLLAWQCWFLRIDPEWLKAHNAGHKVNAQKWYCPFKNTYLCRRGCY